MNNNNPRIGSGGILHASLESSSAISGARSSNILEFCTPKASRSTVEGGVPFRRGRFSHLLVIVTGVFGR